MNARDAIQELQQMQHDIIKNPAILKLIRTYRSETLDKFTSVIDDPTIDADFDERETGEIHSNNESDSCVKALSNAG